MTTDHYTITLTGPERELLRDALGTLRQQATIFPSVDALRKRLDALQPEKAKRA